LVKRKERRIWGGKKNAGWARGSCQKKKKVHKRGGGEKRAGERGVFKKKKKGPGKEKNKKRGKGVVLTWKK